MCEEKDRWTDTGEDGSRNVGREKNVLSLVSPSLL